MWFSIPKRSFDEIWLDPLIHSDHKLTWYGLVLIFEVKLLQNTAFSFLFLDSTENKKWVWPGNSNIDSYKILENYFKNRFKFISNRKMTSSVSAFIQNFKKYDWLFHKCWKVLSSWVKVNKDIFKEGQTTDWLTPQS